MSPAASPAEPRPDYWRKRIEAADNYFRPFHQRYRVELDFCLKLRHYLGDPGNAPEALGRVVFKGRELFGKVRRITADVTAAPLYVECKPVNPADGDPKRAEIAKFALESDVRNPDKGFDDYLECLVLASLAGRVGVMALDYHPECGPYGEILFRNVPFNRLRWDPAYPPWDYRCRWIAEDVPMDVAEARRTWKGFANLVPDDTDSDSTPRYTDEGGRVLKSATYDETEDGVTGQALITKVWSRFDPSMKDLPDETVELPDHAQYMACPSCGYRSEPSPGLPAWSGPCPDCIDQGKVEMLGKVTHETVSKEARQYKAGRRFEVISLKQGLVGEDGSWPQDLRAFPYAVMIDHVHPEDQVGLSETALDGNLQVIINALMNRSYLQAITAPNILAVKGRLENSDGSDLQITDEPWQLAYFNTEDSQFAEIDHFKSDGIAPSTLQVWNMVQGSFQKDVGTGEVGMTSDQSKDIPVGTINAIIESGSVPTDHFIRRLRRVLSRFFGVLHDMQRATWTKERWVRYQGPLGVEDYALMSGATLPNADFIVTADPMSKRFDTEQAKAIAQWYALPPPIRRELAPKFGITPDTVDRIEQAEQQLMQQQAAAAMPPAGPMAAAPRMPAPGGANGPPVPQGGPPPERMAQMAGM